MSDTTSAVERIPAPVKHTHIGGQAVLEGIMMRGKYNWAIAVRTPDGSIYTEEHDLTSAAAKHAWMRKPVIRGVVALVETMSLAMKAFSISADKSGEGEEEQLSSRDIALSMGLGVALAVMLFIVLPALLTNLALSPGSGAGFMSRLTGAYLEGGRNFTWNVVDGILRVAAFFAYIWAISRMEDIQRVFAYHGAEHKTIHAFEHGLPLEAPVIQKHSTQHVRCGTSFLLMVMVIAILVFSLVPVGRIAEAYELTGAARFALVLLSRILLMPLVAGLAYEVTVKWAGNHPDNPLVKVLLWPGLQMQRMTTREPDDSMVEVAVEATRLVVAREELEERLAAGDATGPAEMGAGEAADAHGGTEDVEQFT